MMDVQIMTCVEKHEEVRFVGHTQGGEAHYGSRRDKVILQGAGLELRLEGLSAAESGQFIPGSSRHRLIITEAEP